MSVHAFVCVRVFGLECEYIAAEVCSLAVDEIQRPRCVQRQQIAVALLLLDASIRCRCVVFCVCCVRVNVVSIGLFVVSIVSYCRAYQLGYRTAHCAQLHIGMLYEGYPRHTKWGGRCIAHAV